MPSGGPAGWSRARTSGSRASASSARDRREPEEFAARPRRGRGDAPSPPRARCAPGDIGRRPLGGKCPKYCTFQAICRLERAVGAVDERKRRRRTMTATDGQLALAGLEPPAEEAATPDAREPAAPPAPPSPGFEPTAEQRAAIALARARRLPRGGRRKRQDERCSSTATARRSPRTGSRSSASSPSPSPSARRPRCGRGSAASWSPAPAPPARPATPRAPTSSCMAARATERAWVMTIHAFCRRLLAAHPLAAGLDPRFRVLDARRGRAARRPGGQRGARRPARGRRRATSPAPPPPTSRGASRR